MRLIALVSVASAVSTLALPYTPSGRELGRRLKKVGRQDDPQSSTTLDPGVICSNFQQDGQANATAGQVPSLTSPNNFINFCLTVNMPLTNGHQVKGGSCNPAPMGVIAPSTNIPSSKFVNPKNLDAVQANTPFEVTIAINHLDTGHFTNPDSSYFAAPQQLNCDNDIIGHTHFVIEQLDSATSTTVSDPSKFVFFKGVNTPADAQGNLAINVTDGLPSGVYKLSSIHASANHAPPVVAVAQRGTMDDQIYFFVTPDGQRPQSIF